MQDKLDPAEGRANYEKARRMLAESGAIRQLVVRALTVAADLDGAHRGCKRRRCRRAGRCMAADDGEDACVAPFRPITMMRAEAIAAFRARELIALLPGREGTF